MPEAAVFDRPRQTPSPCCLLLPVRSGGEELRHGPAVKQLDPAAASSPLPVAMNAAGAPTPPAAVRLLPHPRGAPPSPRLSRVPGAPTPRSSSARALLSSLVRPPLHSGAGNGNPAPGSWSASLCPSLSSSYLLPPSPRLSEFVSRPCPCSSSAALRSSSPSPQDPARPCDPSLLLPDSPEHTVPHLPSSAAAPCIA